ADGVLDELDAGGEIVVVDDERAADDVGVAADVLGAGVGDDVGAEGERGLEIGRGEGVVDDGDDRRAGAGRGRHSGALGGGCDRAAAAFHEARDRRDIDDLEHRVARRFEPDQASPGREGGLHGPEVRHVDASDGQPEVTEDLVEHAERATVDIVGEYDVV